MKIVAPAILALAASSSAFAQCVPDADTYCITFGSFYNVNGVPRAALTLTRGVTYTFQMVNIPAAHPFYITTSSTGGFGGPGRYLNGVNPGTSVFGNQAMTFAVPMDAPSTLYYQCSVHSNLGARLDIVDPACAADYNMDGFLDFFDYDEFVACFEDNNACAHGTADFNGDDFVDFFDYDAFVEAFQAGC